MNWFERYGVVGGYFLLLFIGWLYCILDLTRHIELGNAILGAASVLPFGYLIVILSQFFYYVGFGGRQIHNEIGEIIRHNSMYQDKIKLDYWFNEEANEAVITFYDRVLLFSEEKLEAFKFLAKFITKRFDVISINNGIILATFLAPIFTACSILFLYGLKLNSAPSFNIKDMPVFLMTIFSLTSILIAKCINGILNNQILMINKEIFYSRYFKTRFEERCLCCKILRYIMGILGSVLFFYLYYFFIVNKFLMSTCVQLQ